ncbi:MAG: hypothetical protein Q4G25_15910 [Paracoccus sp. (in: a-proteobacteria)]|nr:hypothetical protein [Paracoccus sp. (in: a-proteobacteria)]
MTAFAASIARLFVDPHLAVDAEYRAGGATPGIPIRVIRKAPDEITSYGGARIWSETLIVDVMVAEVAAPRPGDQIVIEAETLIIQGEPRRDRERQVWTLELVPA